MQLFEARQKGPREETWIISPQIIGFMNQEGNLSRSISLTHNFELLQQISFTMLSTFCQFQILNPAL